MDVSTRPIGIFDSGVGGTTIWKEIRQILPEEDCIYAADSKNAPYGEKSEERITELCVKNTEFLLQKNCKIIVVACNTATTNAISYLRNTYQVPFVGIEPAIKPAALQTKRKKVGVLATKGTLASTLFNATSQIHAAGIEILVREGAGLVQRIENGDMESKELRELLSSYVAPMLDEGIDSLVLGCTHYPYLIPLLKQMVPADVAIIDSGAAVAKQVKAVLAANNILNEKEVTQAVHHFYSNTDVHLLKKLVYTGEEKISSLDF